MSNEYYYINGNTVRELEPASPSPRERRVRREVEERRRQEARRKAARRHREKARVMNRGYAFFLTTCIAATAFAAVYMISLQSQLSDRMRQVAYLESQTQNLKAENDALYKEITTSVDLNHIKDVAMNELGMSYATEEQIVYYSVENNNYMDQYRDIPK